MFSWNLFFLWDDQQLSNNRLRYRKEMWNHQDEMFLSSCCYFLSIELMVHHPTNLLIHVEDEKIRIKTTILIEGCYHQQMMYEIHWNSMIMFQDEHTKDQRIENQQDETDLTQKNGRNVGEESSSGLKRTNRSIGDNRENLHPHPRPFRFNITSPTGNANVRCDVFKYLLIFCINSLTSTYPNNELFLRIQIISLPIGSFVTSIPPNKLSYCESKFPRNFAKYEKPICKRLQLNNPFARYSYSME